MKKRKEKKYKRLSCLRKENTFCAAKIQIKVTFSVWDENYLQAGEHWEEDVRSIKYVYSSLDQLCLVRKQVKTFGQDEI